MPENISNINLLKKGERSFLLGIFFLSFLPILSLFFLLFSLFISLKTFTLREIKDKWNLVLLLASVLIIISSLNSLFFNPFEFTQCPWEFGPNQDGKRLLIVVNKLKFILILISFCSFQKYLKTSIQRVNFAKSYLLGAIPLLISCFMQHWLKIYGPFKFLNGLVIWWNKPILDIDQGIAGLFSNQNVTGLWLAILLPFCLYFLFNKKIINLQKFGFILFSATTIYYLLLSTSRGAITGLLISLPFILGIKIAIFLLIVLSLIAILFYFFSPLIPLVNVFNTSLILPVQIEILINKISTMNYINMGSNARIIIWNSTLKFISARPLFGYGAGIFTAVYSTLNLATKANHSHNLILQLAFDYGIPLALLISSFVIILLLKSWANIFLNSIEIYKKTNFIDKFWFASTIIALTPQVFDITYNAGRVTILIWILLAGNKCIVDHKNDSFQQ